MKNGMIAQVLEKGKTMPPFFELFTDGRGSVLAPASTGRAGRPGDRGLRQYGDGPVISWTGFNPSRSFSIVPKSRNPIAPSHHRT